MKKYRNRRKKNMTKIKSERIHAKRRAKERYDVKLYVADLEKIARKIQNNRPGCQFIKRESNRVTHWLVDYKNTTFYVVYDNERKSIITFLPKHHIEEVDA